MVVLNIIRQHGTEGVHGYALVKELEQKTNHMLIIEEGTLYPMLRKLKDEGLVTERQETLKNKRTRKYYSITPLGDQMYNYMVGFFSSSRNSAGVDQVWKIRREEEKEKYFVLKHPRA